MVQGKGRTTKKNYFFEALKIVQKRTTKLEGRLWPIVVGPLVEELFFGFLYYASIAGKSGENGRVNASSKSHQGNINS